MLQSVSDPCYLCTLNQSSEKERLVVVISCLISLYDINIVSLAILAPLLFKERPWGFMPSFLESQVKGTCGRRVASSCSSDNCLSHNPLIARL
jgi:hypothetical protein